MTNPLANAKKQQQLQEVEVESGATFKRSAVASDLEKKRRVALARLVGLPNDNHNLLLLKMSGFQQPDSFDYTNSTEKNYSISKEQVASRGLDEELYVGKHVPERKMMDYTYHTHYTTDRQLFHDDMIDLFHDTVVHDTDHNVTCDKPLHNWLVFTAGPMGVRNNKSFL